MIDSIRTPPGVQDDTVDSTRDDHRRLDGLLAETERLVAGGDFDGAGRTFAVFAFDLDGHIGMEDRVLFPAIDRAAGTAVGPTAGLRREHVEIRRLAEATAAAIRARHPDRFCGAIGALLDVLDAHTVKEERLFSGRTSSVAAPPHG